MKEKLVALILLSLCLGCGKKHEATLVGNWSGSENNLQFNGVSKSWIQYRHPDGTYEILFVYIQDCETTEWVETGTWWTEGNQYYELEKEATVPDIYQYEVMNDSNIRFTLTSNNRKVFNHKYAFVDKKIR